MKNFFIAVSLVSLAACGTSNASSMANSKSAAGAPVAIAADCPTSPLKGFFGSFKGVMAPLSFQGQALPLQNLAEVHAVTGCNTFDFDVHYSNPQSGVETREVKFSGEWDKTKGVFAIAGTNIKGQFRVLRDGQFVASFETTFDGKPAHCEEMMTVVNKDQQLMRSVQCAAGSAIGESMGVRNALVTKVP